MFLPKAMKVVSRKMKLFQKRKVSLINSKNGFLLLVSILIVCNSCHVFEAISIVNTRKIVRN